MQKDGEKKAIDKHSSSLKNRTISFSQSLLERQKKAISPIFIRGANLSVSTITPKQQGAVLSEISTVSNLATPGVRRLKIGTLILPREQIDKGSGNKSVAMSEFKASHSFNSCPRQGKTVPVSHWAIQLGLTQTRAASRI